MGFYGNVSNITRSTFQFDQIYPNRLMMDAETNNDGIYIGRYVLVEYDSTMDFDVFTRIYPVKTKVGSKTETYFYTAPQGDVPQELELVKGQSGVFYYSATDVNKKDETTSYVALKNVVVYKCVKNDAYILGEADAESENKGFVTISSLGTTDGVGEYTKNYNLDLGAYNNSRGYDSTVWMKTYAGDEIKYVMIAELNTVVPTFDVSVDPPSEIPNQPHFGKDSTNVYYDLHVQPSWGFRIKQAEDSSLSDVRVEQTYSYYNVEGNQELGQGTIPVDGDIYYNADGFKVNKSVHNNTIKDTIKLTKGSSKAKVYNSHIDGSKDLITAEDIQELSIHLPSIGNAVADLYDVLYSDERNTTMDWRYHGYENGGLRLSQFFTEKDEETGKVIKEGYKYNPEQMETVVASINTLHDFVGMVIDDKSYNSADYIGDDAEALVQRKQQFINTSDDDTIYYDANTNRYFRKTIGYDYLDEVNYKYTLVAIDADKYKTNMYYVKDGANYLPDLNGTYDSSKEYYTRSTINDEYYDEVVLTNYAKNAYYSLNNGVYTKASGDSFDEELNYYDIKDARVLQTFDGEYKPNKYYEKGTSADGTTVKYTLYNKEYNAENQELVHNGLSEIDTEKQVAQDVVFYQQGVWFYKGGEDDGYYLDTGLVEDRTYYILPEIQKTTIIDVEGKERVIYTPLPNSSFNKITISPEEYYIVDINDEDVKGHIFRQDEEDKNTFIQASVIETKLIKDESKDNLYRCSYGTNNDLKGIKYIPFLDNRKLYTPNDYYAESNNSSMASTEFALDSGSLDMVRKNYYKFDLTKVKAVHNNDTNYFYTPYSSGDEGVSTIGYYFTKDDAGDYSVLTQASITDGSKYYKRSNNDLYVIEDVNNIYDKYTVWNSNASIVPPTITLNRRKEKYVFEELESFGIQYNTLLGLLLEIRKVLATSLETPEETRDTKTVQGCINKLNDIFAYFDNRYPGQFLITDAYDRIVNASITTAQDDVITNVGNGDVDNTVKDAENRWIEVNINPDPTAPQIKYRHNFNGVEDTTTIADKNSNTGNGLNQGSGDTLKLYTPIVDGMGHVVGKNTETVTLPYGYKTFTTAGSKADVDNDLYTTITDNAGETNTTTVAVSGDNKSIANNTQDTMAIEPANKWIQTKVSNDKIEVAHAIHSIDKTANSKVDLNDGSNSITLQDMSFDKAGHLVGNHSREYELPYGFKTLQVVNTAGADNTSELKTASTVNVVADNTQDAVSLTTGNRWIRVKAIDGTDNAITIQHELHNLNTKDATATINLTSDKPQTFTIKEYSFDEAGHMDGTITTTLTVPNNYGIFSDGTHKTTASGTQDEITVVGDAHIIPSIGTDTITITHNTAQTATHSSTASGDVKVFGDSFTIPNVHYDDNGHISSTSTFTISIPAIAQPTAKATTASTADVIKTITINSSTGQIDVSRTNANDLVLTNYVNGTSGLGVRIVNTDSIGQAFKKVENNLDIIQGNDEQEGSIAKSIKDSANVLTTNINEVSGRVTAIENTYATQEYVNTAVANIVDSAPEAFDTLKEIATWIGTGDVEATTASAMLASINTLSTSVNTMQTTISNLEQQIADLTALVNTYHPTEEPGE